MTTFVIIINTALATLIVAVTVGLLGYAIKTAYRDEVSRLWPPEFRDIIIAFYKRTPKRLRRRAPCIPSAAAEAPVPKRADTRGPARSHVPPHEAPGG